jgi:hypothetical protein
MTHVICGRGRLGSRVAALLAADQSAPLSLRIDREQGLIRLDGALPARIERLLICLVPPHPEGGSGWTGLLDGLCRQVQRQQLSIGRVLMVSSTAVYECHEHGWVDAASPVRAISARGAGLLEAEQRVAELSAEHVVVRLAGITGPGYERYEPLRMSIEQPRHAVDVRAAAALCHQLLRQPPPIAAIELVTDGLIYFQQQSFFATETEPQLAALASRYRLMRPSTIARWPVSDAGA